jgi:hypothetical protein
MFGASRAVEGRRGGLEWVGAQIRKTRANFLFFLKNLPLRFSLTPPDRINIFRAPLTGQVVVPDVLRDATNQTLPPYKALK